MKFSISLILICKALIDLCASPGTTQSTTQTQPHFKSSRLKREGELDEEDGEFDPRGGSVV